jgi:BirA family biotin operon repressor/biotin-[acetyl-CoA-carboxylase] ligase
VVVAEEQTAGRGRLDRRWTAPPSSSLLVSALLRPPGSLPVRTWGWLPLLAGLAVAGAVQETAGVDARLKWPNDVVVDGPGWLGDPGPRKLAGLLVEAAGGAVVVGLGLNVDLGPTSCPPAATSLVLRPSETCRRPGAGPEDLLAAVLAGLGRRFEAFGAAAGDVDRSGLRGAYTARCLTLGRPVRATLPGGRIVEGVARGLAPEGALVVATTAGERTVPAGDVVHLDPASG